MEDRNTGSFDDPFNGPDAVLDGEPEAAENDAEVPTEASEEACPCGEPSKCDEQKLAERAEANGGVGFSWWLDTSLLAANRSMQQVFDQLQNEVEQVFLLAEHGFDVAGFKTQLDIDSISAPMIQAGLQVLGLYIPELRDEIGKVLTTFPQIEPNDEQRAQLKEVGEKIAAARRAAFSKAFGAVFAATDEAEEDGPTLN